MKSKMVQAQFQLQDSFVKEFSLKTLKKTESKETLDITGQLGFRILNIKEEKNNYIGQIELINDIKVCDKNGEETLIIHISMCGLFVGNKEYDMKKFEELLKINGATALSHLIRAYVYSATGLAGVTQITTPMVNFIEFFENAQEMKQEEN